MVRARLVPVFAVATWSLVGCQILARQGGAPAGPMTRQGIDETITTAEGQAKHPGADAESKARPWRVAWVRHGGPDLHIEPARGLVLTGGNLYDLEAGLFRGRVTPGTLITLADGRSIARDDEGRLTVDTPQGPAHDPAGDLLARAVVTDGRALATIETRWHDGVARAALVVRSTADLSRTLEVALPGDWSTFSRAQIATAEDGLLLVALPTESSKVPQIVAADVDGSLSPVDFPVEGELLALSADGRSIALAAEDAVEVRDLRSARLLSRVNLEGRRVGATALAPDGSALAVVSTPNPGAPTLQVWRATQGRQRWVETYRGATEASSPALAFAATDHADHWGLWVAADELVALRPGPARQRSPMQYSVALPQGFEATGARPQTGDDAAAGLERLVYQQRAGGDVRVSVRAHDRRTYSPVGRDLGRWSESVFASLYAVPVETLDDPAWAYTAHTDPSTGARITEVVVPACTVGISSTDLYLHLEERGDQLIEVAITTPPGASTQEVARLFATFVDEPLERGPVPRDLPQLPRRECGI